MPTGSGEMRKMTIEDMPADEQVAVTVNLSRDSMRALETMAGEQGFSRTWVINMALQHAANCPRARTMWKSARSL